MSEGATSISGGGLVYNGFSQYAYIVISLYTSDSKIVPIYLVGSSGVAD